MYWLVILCIIRSVKAKVWHHRTSSQLPGQLPDTELSHAARLVTVRSFLSSSFACLWSCRVFILPAVVICHSVAWCCCLVMGLGVVYINIEKMIKTRQEVLFTTSRHTAGPVVPSVWSRTSFSHSVCSQYDFSIYLICILPDLLDFHYLKTCIFYIGAHYQPCFCYITSKIWSSRLCWEETHTGCHQIILILTLIWIFHLFKSTSVARSCPVMTLLTD